MTCQYKDEVLVLAQGRLAEPDQTRLADHLSGCQECRQQLALVMAACRLSLEERAGPDCLDDETLAALVDGALDPQGRQQALEHIGTCAHCLGAWASLGRALEQVEESPRKAPRRLVRRLAAGDGSGRRPSWNWPRLVFAAGSALVVFVAVVWLARPPAELLPKAGPALSPPEVAEASGQEFERSPVAATETDKHPAGSPAPAPEAPESRPAATRPPTLPGDFLAGLLPAEPTPRQPLEQGMALSGHRRSPGESAYLLGRIMAAILLRLEHGAGGKEINRGLEGSMRLLQAIHAQAGHEQLAQFVGELSELLGSPGTTKIKLQARLEVLDQATRQKLSHHEEASWFFETGHLVTRTAVFAALSLHGKRPPVGNPAERLGAQAAALGRLRNLDRDGRQRLAALLNRLRKQLQRPGGKAGQALELLHRLDEAVRSVTAAESR